jgi:anti-sigma regulatory factor (Ser/Thr protein kinase)
LTGKNAHPAPKSSIDSAQEQIQVSQFAQSIDFAKSNLLEMVIALFELLTRKNAVTMKHGRLSANRHEAA